MHLLLAALCWFLVGPAAASGDAPPPPKTDFSKLPPTAAVRPPGAESKPHPVLARLIADHDVLKPGSTVRVGVHLDQDKEWHTYWKTPGDIGLPTTIKWTLSGGGTAEPHIFPVPVRFEQGGMVSFGYDDEVLHTSFVHIPADASPGPIQLEADVEWLVCQTSCIPGMAHLTLPLQIGPEAKASPYGALFDHYAAQWPVSADRLSSLVVKASVDSLPILPEATFRVAFDVRAAAGHTLAAPEAGKMWPTFAPITGSDWMVTASRIEPGVDGGFVVVVDAMAYAPEQLPAKDSAGGLLQVLVDGAWVRTEVHTPLPWAPAGSPRKASAEPVWQKLSAAAPPGEPAATGAPVGGPEPVAAPPASATITPLLLMMNLAMAFVGGLILNVMPCVLPVLTLKLYSLVEQADIPDADKKTAGLAYTAGILASFWLLAAAVWGARAAFGMDVGWGFQFQYPGYVAALATLVFGFGLSLFGVFELPAVGVQSADQLGSREGAVGYFFTGVFATLVATPCSAPFLGTAIAFAFQAPTPLLFLAFSFIGLGLASPFLLVAFVPSAWKLMPRPGAWMEGFKQLLGFSLVATTIWLVDVLAAQVGRDGATGFLAFLLVFSVGTWIYGRWGGLAAEPWQQLRALVAGLAVTAFGGWMFLDLQVAEASTCDDGATVQADLSFDEHVPWQPFHEKRLASLAGKTVFIDFTADWCVSCKVNERTVLESTSVREAMKRLGVVPLKADWTRRDELIGAWLQRYGRAGVPLYLVVPPSGTAYAMALPEVITPDMVIEALDKASSPKCATGPC